jgi:hypothetical protein
MGGQMSDRLGDYAMPPDEANELLRYLAEQQEARENWKMFSRGMSIEEIQKVRQGNRYSRKSVCVSTYEVYVRKSATCFVFADSAKAFEVSLRMGHMQCHESKILTEYSIPLN